MRMVIGNRIHEHPVKVQHSRNHEWLMTQNLHYVVHHPLFESIMAKKIQKCYQHGHIRTPSLISKKKKLNKNQILIQAPYIKGNIKTINFRKIHRKSLSVNTLRKKLTSANCTVIRSRTAQPQLKQRLQAINIHDEIQQTLKPSKSIKKYIFKK